MLNAEDLHAADDGVDPQPQDRSARPRRSPRRRCGCRAPTRRRPRPRCRTGSTPSRCPGRTLTCRVTSAPCISACRRSSLIEPMTVSRSMSRSIRQRPRRLIEPIGTDWDLRAVGTRIRPRPRHHRSTSARRRQVRHHTIKIATGTRGERLGHPIAELLQREAAFRSREVEPLHHGFPLRVGYAYEFLPVHSHDPSGLGPGGVISAPRSGSFKFLSVGSVVAGGCASSQPLEHPRMLGSFLPRRSGLCG